MNIIATNSSFDSPPEFIFAKCVGADKSMKDYTKMTILLAMKEYPNDYSKKVGLILEKFEEKYGGHWSCAFMKIDGGSCGLYYYDYFINLKYGDYKICIAKTSDE